MSLLLDILLYTGIGFLEWFLAMRRFSAMLDLKIYFAPMLVVTESVVGYFVINRFIVSNDWSIVLSASMGAGLGTYVELRRRKGIGNAGQEKNTLKSGVLKIKNVYCVTEKNSISNIIRYIMMWAKDNTRKAIMDKKKSVRLKTISRNEIGEKTS
jgi:hypothetical protein